MSHSSKYAKVLTICLLTYLADAGYPELGELLCREDKDCQKYHYCEQRYQGLGRLLSSRCHTKVDDSCVEPCEKGQHRFCHEKDTTVRKSESSTHMCFEIDQKFACRPSYFMPCKSRRDCAFGFRCKFILFSDGWAQACYPKKIYSGGGNPCKKDQDCGMRYYKWVECGENGMCPEIQV